MHNLVLKKDIHKILYGIVGMFLMIPGSVDAARLFLDPQTGEYPKGDTFVATLRLDNEGECLNALDVQLEYDKDSINAIDVGVGESLITLWVEKPDINQSLGVITFSGGIPGGYCGRIVGDPGQSNIIAKIAFSTTGFRNASAPGDIGRVMINPKTQVLLNDGLGTPAKLTLEGAVYKVGESRGYVTNEWIDETTEDKIPPEPFEVRIHQNPSVADGKYYIVFSTTDKQSGIDHFEVFETDIENGGYEVGTGKQAYWNVIDNTTYYVLKDQTLQSRIVVKALDKAGNEQIAELSTRRGADGSGDIFSPVYIIWGVVLLFILGAIIVLWATRSRKEETSVEYVYEEGEEGEDHPREES